MKKVYLNTLTPEDIIKRLKDGEIIKIKEYEDYCFKMIDGVICYITDTNTYIQHQIDSSDTDLYFEEQEEFNVEKTGRYRTRDGKTAYVSFVGKENAYGIVDGFQTDFHWYKDGSHLMFKEDDLDLVEYVGY